MMRSSPAEVIGPGRAMCFFSLIIFYMKRNKMKNTNAIYLSRNHWQPFQSLDTVPLS
jgi:hypothetical protein